MKRYLGDWPNSLGRVAEGVNTGIWLARVTDSHGTLVQLEQANRETGSGSGWVRPDLFKWDTPDADQLPTTTAPG